MKAHMFGPAVDTANHWLDHVVERLDLHEDRPRALHALRAGLHSIRDRLPANEVVDLAAQLPTLIRGIYFEGWRLANDPGRIRDRAAMIARVRSELVPDPRLDPVDVLRVALELLVEHISAGELQDIVATLPRPVAALWRDLTGHAIDDLDAEPRLAAGLLSRRTGYSR